MLIFFRENNRLKMFGHCLRREHNHICSKSLRPEVSGRWSKGRPKKIWMNNIKKDMKKYQLTEDMAQYRKYWMTKIMTGPALHYRRWSRMVRKVRKCRGLYYYVNVLVRGNGPSNSDVPMCTMCNCNRFSRPRTKSLCLIQVIACYWIAFNRSGMEPFIIYTPQTAVIIGIEQTDIKRHLYNIIEKNRCLSSVISRGQILNCL